MSSIRMIATDLDGTLLRGDGSISSRTREALAAAQEVGLVVVFVTARPPRDVHAIAADLRVNGMAVCSNGAILYDLNRQKVMRQASLPSQLARHLAGMLRQVDADFRFGTEHGHKVGYEPAFPRFLDAFVHHHPPMVDHVDVLCGEELIKLLVHHPTHQGDALATVVSAAIGLHAQVNHSGAEFVEIGVSGISKASGLSQLGDQLGIAAHEMIAFGDMPNDIPMLQMAGRGVAVANAHVDVLSVASETTETNEADGVAIIIEHLLASPVVPVGSY